MVLRILSLLLVFGGTAISAQYYGKKLSDSWINPIHDISGTVYVSDERTLTIIGFSYDGNAPDAFFYLGNKPYSEVTAAGAPVDSTAIIIPNEEGLLEKLDSYENGNLTLKLPEGQKITDFKYFSVWCREFRAYFGGVDIPANFEAPAPQDIGQFSQLAHGVKSGEVTVLDSRTFLIRDLYYDGQGPDAHFYIGNTERVQEQSQSPYGKIPGENGRTTKLPPYTGQDVTITLPEGVTVYDIKWLSMWCIIAVQDFGHVRIPANLNVPPYAEAASIQTTRAPTRRVRTTTRRRVRTNTPTPDRRVQTTTTSTDNESTGNQLSKNEYYGKKLSDTWVNPMHDVSGTVYISDEKTIVITDLTYDGAGPDAFFYLGNKPYDEVTRTGTDDTAVIIPNEKGSLEKLEAYNGEDIVLVLPEGLKITDFKYISLWCRRFTVYFGGIEIPANFVVPASHDIGQLSRLAHGVRSGEISVLDEKTILIRDLRYDGAGPNTRFYVGKTEQVQEQVAPYGSIPDENGSMSSLSSYDGQDVTLTLPGDLTVFNIKWLSLWCIPFSQNFGHVVIPDGLDVPSSFAKSVTNGGDDDLMNCEMLNDDLQISWLIKGDDIFFELAGSIDVDEEYMSFGLSGSERTFSMIGADVVVADFTTSVPRALDYYLSAYSQCSRGRGACPDSKSTGENDVTSVTGSKEQGILRIQYSRPLDAGDSLDQSYLSDGTPQQIVWGIGPINSNGEAAKHTQRISESTAFVFNRPVVNNCGTLTAKTTVVKPPFLPHQLSGDDTKIFTFEIGLSGAEQGYGALTGFPSWGIAWYVNGILIPELYLKRGETYTFRIAGGRDPANAAQYHPLYVTSSNLGGFSQTQNESEVIYPGALNGVESDYGVGDYCEWKFTNAALQKIRDGEVYPTFEAMKADLRLDCNGKTTPQYGEFKWTPDESTPDLVYYQCYTHLNLGWKIHIEDGDGESTTKPRPTTRRETSSIATNAPVTRSTTSNSKPETTTSRSSRFGSGFRPMQRLGTNIFGSNRRYQLFRGNFWRRLASNFDCCNDNVRQRHSLCSWFTEFGNSC